MEEKIFYSIAEVAEQTGLPKHVIRFWETEFPEIKPDRRAGRRYYRQSDIDVISRIKDIRYKKGFTIKGARKFLSAEGARGDKVFSDFKMDEGQGVLEPVQEESRILKKYSFAGGSKVDAKKIIKRLAEIEEILEG
jgi:DNA-binding transcriptional MerR regulator